MKKYNQFNKIKEYSNIIKTKQMIIINKNLISIKLFSKIYKMIPFLVNKKKNFHIISNNTK